jgi:hypothetical protein
MEITSGRRLPAGGRGPAGQQAVNRLLSQLFCLGFQRLQQAKVSFAAVAD